MVIVAFKPGEKEISKYEELDQYDYGQILRIQGLNLPPAVEIHFALQKTGGTSKTRIGITKDGVTDVPIPDSMLENGDTEDDYSIYAFIYITDETSGQTEYRITLRVKARPKPEAFDRPEDAEIFKEAIKAVNESAARSAESEKQAEGWAHGREDLPERTQDNAMYYAGKTEKDAEKTATDRKEVKRLVESVSGIGEQVEKVEGLTKQAQTSATNAALSEQAAKESENNAAQARAGAEVAEDNAELAAQRAEQDKAIVEQAKNLVKQMGQEVLDNKNLVDETAQDFTLKAQQVLADVNNAGQTQTERVQTAGNDAVESVKAAQGTATRAVETAKTEAIEAVQTEGTTQAGNVSAEGEKQVQAVRGAAQEIMADREQIQENKTGIAKLKEDLGNIATAGENLFNPKGTRHLNSRIDYNGNIAAGYDIVYELPVDGGTYVSNMPTFGVYKIACISKDGTATIVTPSTTSDFEEHFTLPDGTVKAYMSFWSGRDSEVESVNYAIFKKGMIVSGNTLPSEYIPYYKNLNDDIKVNESNIKDGTKLNKYIDTEALRKEVSNALFDEALNLIDSGAYLRGTLSTSGVVVEISDSTANYIYTIKIPDGIFIGMNAVPQIICFYDENMKFLESKQLVDTSDDTISVNIPDKGKYAKLSYWYGRGVDGSFEHITHLKDISVVIDSIPFSAIKKDPTLDSTKKITRDNLCDGFELNSKLATGIKWYILGDSRSVDLAYTTKFYHDYLCEKHKFVRKKNLAVSGARIRSADTAYHSLLEQYPSVGEDADLITIYAGINDYGQDNPTEIGTEGSTDLTTFYGAFESLITNLITNHPMAKIVVITPIPQYNFEINNTIVWGDRNGTNALGKSLDDYCNAIKKICRKYGVFVKDACYESGITPRITSQRSEYFKDGLHHNEKGHLVLANYLSDIFDLLDC